MSKKRTYRRESVNSVNVESLRKQVHSRSQEKVFVGMDIAKQEIVACLRWGEDDFQRPWNVKNPSEISQLVKLLTELKQAGVELTIGMESTGTYGEAIRRALTNADLCVHRVSGKAVKDYREIFDGVPSQHDGKDAAMIAELTSYGKGTPWPYEPPNETESQMHHRVHRLNAFQDQVKPWFGRLEGVLAKHWPELSGLIKVNSVTALKLLAHYGSPEQLAADPQAAARLRTWSRGMLKPKRIDAILMSARETAGLPMTESERAWLLEIVAEVDLCLQHIKACQDSLQTLASQYEPMKAMVKSAGAVTLCVLWVTVGNPRNFDSAGAFLKALGLNLKELSSGKRKGELAITKRGPSLARKFLFFWALRASKQGPVRIWYHGYQRVGRSGSRNSEHRKIKGLIAIMRKLCRSLWHVCNHDAAFDYRKVFPGEPLQKRTRGRQPAKRNRRTPEVASMTT